LVFLTSVCKKPWKKYWPSQSTRTTASRLPSRRKTSRINGHALIYWRL